MDIAIPTQNITNKSFNILAMSGELYAVSQDQNFHIADLSNFTAQTIAPRSQVDLMVQARLSLIGLANDIVNAWQYGFFKQTLILNAKANVDNLIISVTEKFDV